jgi:hypothetical protein
VAVSREDLERQLRDHYDFLKRSGEAFDAGYEGEAKRLATSVRVLVHDGQGRPLLRLLGAQKKIADLDTAGTLIPGNMLPENHLTMVRFGPGTAIREVAPLDDGPPVSAEVSFGQWWSTPVLRDHAGNVWNRHSLVVALANQDGGAHVDPALDEAYAALSRGNSMGWMISTSDDPTARPMPNPVPVSVRQIAHELTRTLERHLPRELGLTEPPGQPVSA